MFWVVATAALAHEPGLSRVTVVGNHLSLQVARTDAPAPMTLLDGVTATVEGAPCSITDVDVNPDDNGFLATATLRCPLIPLWTAGSGIPLWTAGSGIPLSGASPLGDTVEVTAAWFDQVPAGHRTIVEVNGSPVAFLDADQRTFTTSAAPSAGTVVAGYVKFGIEHILLGFDHLLFLVGLLLVTKTFQDIAGVVTGFTVAHSVTLTLGALGWVTLPAAIVEPAIAASIVWVGVENLWDPPARRRFGLTLMLGLLHGLGFAGVLTAIGLPKDHLLVGLVAFNVGVEVGQLAVAAVVLPGLFVLRHRIARWPTLGVRVASLVVATIGAVWFVERLYGVLSA